MSPPIPIDFQGKRPAAMPGFLGLAIGITILAHTAPSSLAEDVSVANFSFEEPARVDGGFLDNGVTGWVGSGSTVGVFNPLDGNYPGTTGTEATLPQPALGRQLAYINNDGTLTTAAPIAVVTTNTEYVLTVAVGSRLDAPPNGSVYRIALLVDGVEAAFTSLAVSEVVLPSGTFTNLSAAFTTTADDVRSGGELKVQLLYDEDNTQAGQGNFDNVRVTARNLDPPPLPQPAIAAMRFDGGICDLSVTNLDTRADYTILQSASLAAHTWSTTTVFRAVSMATNIAVSCTNATQFLKIEGSSN